MQNRYVPTHVNRDHMRTLSRPNQGRNHFDDRAAAQKWIDAVMENTSVETIKQVYGEQAVGTFEVRAVECYDHGDAVGRYFPLTIGIVKAVRCPVCKLLVGPSKDGYGKLEQAAAENHINIEVDGFAFWSDKPGCAGSGKSGLVEITGGEKAKGIQGQ